MPTHQPPAPANRFTTRGGSPGRGSKSHSTGQGAARRWSSSSVSGPIAESSFLDVQRAWLRPAAAGRRPGAMTFQGWRAGRAGWLFLRVDGGGHRVDHAVGDGDVAQPLHTEVQVLADESA